jgi:hypothetical protein
MPLHSLDLPQNLKLRSEVELVEEEERVEKRVEEKVIEDIKPNVLYKINLKIHY